MLVSLSGVIFLSKKMESWLDTNLKLLVSFSAGVFLVISYQLVNETLEHSENLIIAISTILFGIVATALISKLLPETHHHDTPHDCHHKINANRILFGDALHNIADGFILVPAYLISLEVGIILTMGIIVHEFIQEISQFFILKETGMSTKNALLKNLLASSTILIGIALGIFVSNFHELEILILGVAAGSFLYVFIVDLMPNIKRSIPLAIAGAIVFILISGFTH